ncbi:MAG: hypothetical protein A3K10_15185 [Bacteroidetes bacterium RIFCSPLOWO2_12_FULL_31_6]|nr:MAG: hypothetical protein A3K10_15185 [Bacteroidetes bacterium RIFCSPLOWO2_12_FULL_31_6]
MASRIELENKPFLQLILILSLCLISVILFSILGTVLSIVLYDFYPNSYYNLAALEENQIAGIKILQLFGAVGLFMIPPLIYGIIASKKPFKVLSLNTFSKAFNYILIIMLMVAFAPFLSWVIELNSNMSLPSFMGDIEKWMVDLQTKADLTSQYFLTFNSFWSLFYILIIVAVVPALGEELLFRGVLQKIFINWTKNAHLGIWITAIFFSALHLQFFGFFPRLLLGLLFGYIFWWSKSLWLPIVGHFINNGSVVIASYFYPDSIKEADISIFKDSEYSLVFYSFSFVISAVLFYLIRGKNKKELITKQKENSTAV